MKKKYLIILFALLLIDDLIIIPLTHPYFEKYINEIKTKIHVETISDNNYGGRKNE